MELNLYCYFFLNYFISTPFNYYYLIKSVYLSIKNMNKIKNEYICGCKTTKSSDYVLNFLNIPPTTIKKLILFIIYIPINR